MFIETCLFTPNTTHKPSTYQKSFVIIMYRPTVKHKYNISDIDIIIDFDVFMSVYDHMHQ